MHRNQRFLSSVDTHFSEGEGPAEQSVFDLSPSPISHLSVTIPALPSLTCDLPW